MPAIHLGVDVRIAGVIRRSPRRDQRAFEFPVNWHASENKGDPSEFLNERAVSRAASQTSGCFVSTGTMLCGPHNQIGRETAARDRGMHPMHSAIQRDSDVDARVVVHIPGQENREAWMYRFVRPIEHGTAVRLRSRSAHTFKERRWAIASG